MAAQKKAGARYMVMERAYVGDRFKWISLGYDGLNGHADFVNKNMPPYRWEKHFGDEWLKPWRAEGEGKYYLLVGQVSRDAAVRHIPIQEWLSSMSYACKKLKKEVMFRPHPEDVKKHRVKSVSMTKTSKRRTLAEDLSEAEACLTYNSNTGTEAVLAGVPVLAENKGSMVYDLAIHDLGQPFKRPDRTQWAHNIAYAQWLREEIEKGDAWDHLKRKYE
jgi:hypothetical protein